MNLREVANINGMITPLHEAQIPVLDRGLLYGDGVFEGFVFHTAESFTMRNILLDSIVLLKKIRLPMPNRQVFEKALFDTMEASGSDTGYFRIIATRGVGAMGINPAKPSATALYIIATTIQLYPEEKYEQGVKLIVARTQKIPLEASDCSVKSLCYLPNIMAMWEAIDAGADEAIMTDANGIVSEATVDNIFGVKDGRIFTPSLDTNCLPGITRARILEIGKSLNIPVSEGKFTADHFRKADEVFLTGTGAGIVPVRQIDNVPIVSRGMGKVTHKLREAYAGELEGLRCTAVA